MIALLQRVSEASVAVDGVVVGSIGHGLLALVCAERGDAGGLAEGLVERLVDKVLRLRIFGDAQGRMNRSLQDIDGGLLVVPQFTLAADTSGGTRPSFTPAAPPDEGRRMFERFVHAARARHAVVQTGSFGAHMQVALVNDGPVTIWLRLP